MIEAKIAVGPRENSRGLLATIVGARSKTEIRNALWGYAFLLPWLLGLTIFVGGPVIASFLLGFTEYSVLRDPRWVGLENYRQAFTRDTLFWPSLWRTTYYSVIVVPLSIMGSLLLAILLNQGIHGTNIFRTMFFLPHLTPSVAMAVLWLWLLSPRLGPINHFLSLIGLPGDFPWLTSRTTVIPSLQLISLWAAVGGNTMLIFLAALQGVPEELYEAAEIDGAGILGKFLHVTLAMISPAIFFNLVLGIIGALQVFTLAFVATGGGPAYGSYFFALHIYNQAFEYFRMGYGSALAWIFLAIVVILTIFQLKVSNRWVYYGGGE